MGTVSYTHLDVFREICLEALVHDSTDDQYGLIGGHPYDGYSASVGTNSVLIGSVAAMRSGISGWDFRNGEEWIQEDGTSIIGLLYKKYFENADGEFKTQPGIAFADLYHGSNVWVSEKMCIRDRVTEAMEAPMIQGTVVPPWWSKARVQGWSFMAFSCLQRGLHVFIVCPVSYTHLGKEEKNV